METMVNEMKQSAVMPNPNWAQLPLFDRSKWDTLPFGAFADCISERAHPTDFADAIYVGLEHLDPENLHIRRWGKGSDVEGVKLRFYKGDIIFGRRRAYQRKLAVAEVDGICSAHAMVVRANPELCLPEFLPFLMMSDAFMKRAVEISVGSLSPTISWGVLKQQRFALPPLDQQRRIAELLWAVDEVSSTGEELLHSSESAFQAQLKYEFETLASTANRQKVALDSVAHIMVSGVDKKSKAEEVPVRLCNYMDVYRNRYVLPSFEFMAATALPREIERHTLQGGDVLFTKDSEDPNDIAVPALVTEDMPGVLCGYHLAQVRTKADRLDPAYLLFVLQSQVGFKHFSSSAKGATRFAIGLGEIRSFTFHIPKLEEQQRAVVELKKLESFRNHIQNHIADTRALLRGMVNSALPS
jgi:hypothetical protein